MLLVVDVLKIVPLVSRQPAAGTRQDDPVIVGVMCPVCGRQNRLSGMGRSVGCRHIIVPEVIVHGVKVSGVNRLPLLAKKCGKLNLS